jgi:NAD(P)-dependent dehydrogenase (short-subunit alcohol dehydrogenase family)
MKENTSYRCFENKNVLIIGGSSGIGLATAVSFMENGSNVYIGSRSVEKLEKAKEQIINRNLPGKIFTERMDINNLELFSKKIDELEVKGEGIDILVNSSGTYPHIPLAEVKEDDWDKVFSTNLKSVFFVSQIISAHMKNRNGGTIVNLGSFAAEMPSVNTGIYAASKSAIISLTRSMAAEWAPFNIRVNAINPGVIRTAMTEKVVEEREEALKSQIALYRIGMPKEVASVILFLCSDSASYITGEVINVTGGKFVVQNPEQAWQVE